MLNWIKSLFKPRHLVVPYKYDIFERAPGIQDYTLVRTGFFIKEEAEEWTAKWG